MAKVTSSYGMEIRHKNRIFAQTIALFNGAISFCVKAFEEEWESLKALPSLSQKNVAEHLVHSTKDNVAKYQEFDDAFYKMPSYLRRSAISYALGYLSSYHSNLDNWESGDRKGRKPTLQCYQNKLPSFYRGGMYRTDGSDTAELKLYLNHDWVWVPVQLKHTDMQYIRRHCNMEHIQSPVLERKNRKWFLRFSFEEEVALGKKEYCEQTILSVDLGINTDATCSVMRADGTVLARKFINFASDKDRLYHALNKIKKVSRTSGSHNTKALWREATFHNEELARKVAKSITDFATGTGCDVIVFEHLDIRKRPGGKSRQKLHMWRKNSIQSLVEHKAHLNGIRISRICAWGTSRLAYDGSGAVVRGAEAGFATKELCRFQNGKQYNCDLSASYNIGARYFLREIEKSISERKWSCVAAKVPDCRRRTLSTYATLLEVNRIA